MWSAPLDPRQTSAIRADGGCSIEIRTFSQQMPGAVSQINGDESMLILLLLNRQNLPACKMQITITTLA
jgi:hypothetical protein